MKDIVVFGTGEIGRDVIWSLKDCYNILFFTDNDKNKWNSTFGGYDVKPPIQIQQYECDILIASTKYAISISDQIRDMGINQDRIYLCRRIWTDNGYESDIYPLDAQKVTGTGKRLIEYDLLDTEEYKIKHRKILVFCARFSTYAKQLIENMSGRYHDIEFSLLTSAEESQQNINSSQLKHIYCFKTMSDLKTILEQLPVYDAMQLLWIEQEWAYFYKLIRRRTGRLNLNVGGSDFYRTGKAEKDFRKKLIAGADKVTAETVGTVQEFKEYYIEEAAGKVDLLPFGIEVLEQINRSWHKDKNKIKQKYHIPPDKIVVTCGHNASEAHRHMDIINAAKKLPKKVKQKIVCVFPMTYPKGREKYIDKIISHLAQTELDYVILIDYMDFQSMAEYAIVSDIMLHVQTTDQLSSTMLEEMYAGSVVIAGSWLPYHSLHQMGIYFLNVDEISDVASVLEDVVENIEEYKEKCKGNQEIVWKHSSWDELAPKWRALWD